MLAVAALGVVALLAPGTHGPAEITIADGPGPGSGTFRISGTHRDSATCISLARRVRSGGAVGEYLVRGCPVVVPKRRQLRGYAAYVCPVDEMLVVGAVTRKAARVDVELWDGQRLDARIFTPPAALRYRAHVFALLTREQSATGSFVDDIHPRSIRAYTADGTALATQRFRSGTGRAFGCF